MRISHFESDFEKWHPSQPQVRIERWRKYVESRQASPEPTVDSRCSPEEYLRKCAVSTLSSHTLDLIKMKSLLIHSI